jgi:hypothetical protein
MSEVTQKLRATMDNVLDALEMSGFNDGFEAAINSIDELSNQLHNNNDTTGAETLRWAAAELRGDNAETN